MERLTDLLPAQAIALDVAADDWRAALRAAGELLEHSGTATADYTSAMIGSVEQNGPYIVLTPGFAFAHARPSEAVTRTGMAWVRLAEPVEFGHAKNDPVTLIAALAATDADQHRTAMAQLAKVLANPQQRRALEEAPDAEAVRVILGGGGDAEVARSAPPESASDSGTAAGAAPTATGPGNAAGSASQSGAAPGSATEPAATVASKGRILTACGNGVGTSLFLKNTLDGVLDRWGWSKYIQTEAADTISARGKAKENDLILTSGEIARAIGDVGVPVRVIEDFTSAEQVEAALRATYEI